jgi:hypothetical protein
MDASAFISRGQWEQLLSKLGLNEEHICEGRYNQIIHMVIPHSGSARLPLSFAEKSSFEQGLRA